MACRVPAAVVLVHGYILCDILRKCNMALWQLQYCVCAYCTVHLLAQPCLSFLELFLSAQN